MPKLPRRSVPAVFALFSITLLAACAPSTGPSGTTTQDTGPLKVGETWTISGLDQNNNPLEGKVKLIGVPRYDNQDRDWTYRGDRGTVYLYEQGNGARFVVWDTSNPKRLVACVVFREYTSTQDSYTGAGLAGTSEEINAVFAKLRGSGTKLVGGDCKVTRSGP